MNDLIKNVTLNTNNIEIANIIAKAENAYLTNVCIEDDILTFTLYSKITYEELVNQLIAKRYTIQEELAIQRKHQKGVNNAEFEEYDNYVENCKVKAKAFIEEREAVLNENSTK